MIDGFWQVVSLESAENIIPVRFSFRTCSDDHWPMVSANQAGYELRKHETFRLIKAGEDKLIIKFAADGSDSSRWDRMK